MERQAQLARAVGEAKASRPLAKDVMAEAMMYFRGLAARYQPGTREKPNPAADESKFEKYLGMAADIAKNLAPYESPKLAQTTLRGEEDAPIRAKIEVEFV